MGRESVTELFLFAFGFFFLFLHIVFPGKYSKRFLPKWLSLLLLLIAVLFCLYRIIYALQS